MGTLIDIHTHNPLSINLGVQNYRLGVDEKPTSKSLSAGIHPWDAERLLPHLERVLEELRGVECVAIGEVGLDKAASTPFEVQKEIFTLQVEVAASRNLPLIIHCVKAQAEVIEILSRYPTLKAIFHGYIGSPEQLQELVSKRYYISFGFNSLRSPKTRKAIAECPTDRLFLESDTTEENIESLYHSVANIKGLSVEDLTEIININYKRFFQ